MQPRGALQQLVDLGTRLGQDGVPRALHCSELGGVRADKEECRAFKVW